MTTTAIPEHCTTSPETPTEDQFQHMLAELSDGWRILESNPRRLKLEFTLEDFQAAVDRLNAIAKIAESENHHPDLAIHDYKHLTVMISTHDAGGLTANDFVVAREIDRLG